jgi:hypothetical protein
MGGSQIIAKCGQAHTKPSESFIEKQELAAALANLLNTRKWCAKESLSEARQKVSGSQGQKARGPT